MDGAVYEPDLKRRKFHDDDQIVENFAQWMCERKFEMSPKVKMSKTGSCARYGLIAVHPVEKGDILFKIPRSSLLWEQNCSISDVLCSVDFPESKSGWVKLVICLMFEYKNANSHFRPYLDFAPPTSCLDQPMFWDESARKWLKGTGILDLVSKDNELIEREYAEIALPFIKRKDFDPKIYNLDLYKHMVAFIMAYSFTEPSDDSETNNTPIMVPMADVLNHVAKNNAQLEFETDHLKMVAVETIEAGSEIFNTYGCLANWQLLQMYGFVQDVDDNFYDTVDVELAVFYDILTSADFSFCLTQDKVNWLRKKGGLPGDHVITMGREGVLSCFEFKRLAKVLLATRDEFFRLRDESNDSEWESDSSVPSSDEDASEFEVVTYHRISKMPKQLRKLIEQVARKSLTRYETFAEAESDVQVPATDETNTSSIARWRYERARTLVEGQRCNLRRLCAAAATR